MPKSPAARNDGGFVVFMGSAIRNKTYAVAWRRPHDESELITKVKNYLGSIAHSKLSVKAYFQEDHVCYAAA
jgi:hypothetical protein